MEFAAAALPALITGGSLAAGGGVAGLAGGAAGVSAGAGGIAAGVSGSGLLAGLGGVAGFGSLAGSILSGAATVGSVLATQRAGEAQAQSLELAALDAGVDAKIEQNQGIERRTTLKAALVQALGERDVATAASGVDLSFGTPVVARGEAVKDTERALTVDQQTEKLRVARLRERAASYRLMAAQTREGSLAKAAGIGLTGAAALLRRG